MLKVKVSSKPYEVKNFHICLTVQHWCK